MLSDLLKKIILYVSLLLFMLSIITSIACKKNDQKQIGNNTEVNAKEAKKETISCLDIKDYPKLSNDNYNFSYSSVSGNEEDSLKKNCYSFYSEYWKDRIKDQKKFDKEDPSSDGLKKIKKIVKNPELDVTIKLIKGNIAIINRTTLGLDGLLGLEKVDDIWIFRSNKWQLLTGYEGNYYRKVRLLHINNDEYIDAVVEGGCCDSSEINIFLGDKDKVLRSRQVISIIGIGGLEYTNRCNSKFDVKPYDTMVEKYASKPKLAVFDCSINGYVITEIK